METYQDSALRDDVKKAVAELGFTSTPPVQAAAIPVIMESDRDLVALARTGTGKTAGFGLPLVNDIDVETKGVQALILCPTRELCLQITNELQLYSKYVKGLRTVAIYGGASITEQARQIKKVAQIVVATPGRMKDMIGRRMLDTS